MLAHFFEAVGFEADRVDPFGVVGHGLVRTVEVGSGVESSPHINGSTGSGAARIPAEGPVVFHHKANKGADPGCRRLPLAGRCR